MSKKIIEIAKELDVKPGVVIEKLRQLGIDASSVASQISPEDHNKLLDSMGKNKGVTNRKITKVTAAGNVVSNKKVIVRAKPKDGSQKENSQYIVGDNSSDLMSGMIRDGEKAVSVKPEEKPEIIEENKSVEKPKVIKKTVPKPKLKVTVIKRHHHEEEPEESDIKESSAIENTDENKPSEVAEVVNASVSDDATEKEIPEKVEKNEKTEPEQKKQIKPVVNKKTAEPEKKPAINTQKREADKKHTVKNESAEPEKKLGPTGRKIELTPRRKPEPPQTNPRSTNTNSYTPNRQGTFRNDRPDSDRTGRPNRPESSDRPSRPESSDRTGRTNRPDTFDRTNRPSRPESSDRTGRPSRPDTTDRSGRPSRPNMSDRTGRPGRPSGSDSDDKPSIDILADAKPSKKIAKITYKKVTKTPDNSDAAKKATTSKTSFTNTKSSKYRSSHFVSGRTRNVNEVLSEDYILNEYYSDDNIRIRRSKRKGDLKPRKEILSQVKLPENMTVKVFAERVKKQSSDVILKLMALGIMASINDEIDFDTASLVADEYNINAVLDAKVTEEDILFDDDIEDTDESLLERAPVVVVMGHVDHGKTSLLDTIKNTDVVATEAGAITQHVGAYSVHVKNRLITFLDTPGHEAFTSMRRRGAQVTDIAIIVVAADDGIMPQTVEALNHAKEAGVAIIVAINKIDLPAANPDRVKQELTEYGIVPEEWGGDVICVPVSAKTGENIDNLLDMVLLSADVLELKANPDRQAKGIVIESKLDEHKGVIATMLVQRGTLRTGDCIICGTAVGRVRAMSNDKGETIEEASPSTPAVVLGLDEVPGAGETFYSVEDEKTARSLADKRRFSRQQLRTSRKPATLDELFEQIQEGSVKELKIIVKADVRGSVEAVTESLEKLSNEEVSVKVIHGAAGTISESDISLAEVSGAIIIGFNVRPGNNVTQAAKEAGVDVRLYRIIYNAVNDVEAAMKGMLDPKFKEVVTGHAQIRQIFKVSGLGTIGGCMVTDGNIKRNSEVRLVRDGIVVIEGKLGSLKRFQDDVKEVQSGYECGMSIEKYNDIKEDDIIEAFEMVEIKE